MYHSVLLRIASFRKRKKRSSFRNSTGLLFCHRKYTKVCDQPLQECDASARDMTSYTTFPPS